MGVKALRGAGQFFVAHDLAPFDRCGFAADQVERNALSPACVLQCLSVHLDAAHAKAFAAGQADQVFPHLDLAGMRRAGHHQPVALEREGAIHGHAEVGFWFGLGAARKAGDDGGLQGWQALTGDRGEGQHGRALERRARGQHFYFLLDFADACRRGEIRLGDDEQALGDAQESHDVEVLLCLGHDPVVGCDGEQNKIDAVRAGQHIAHEAFMARYIDDAGLGAVGQIQMRKPEVDGNAALFFFLEAVGVLPGQDFDETGLAVINMSGGADNVWHEIVRTRGLRPLVTPPDQCLRKTAMRMAHEAEKRGNKPNAFSRSMARSSAGLKPCSRRPLRVCWMESLPQG